MKTKGCSFEFEEERNAELHKVFIEKLKLLQCSDSRAIWELIARSPSKRFWVSEPRAIVVISRMMQGDRLFSMRPLKKKMYEEIYRRVMQYRRRHRYCTLRQAVHAAVHSRAPQFYMKPLSIRETIYKIERGFYEKRNQEKKYGR